MRKIALLGSTGSIGRNTLAVVAANRERFQIISLAAGSNLDLLATQIKEFNPAIISVKNKEDADILKQKFPGKKIYHGAEGLLEAVAHSEINTMVSAIDGTTALAATLYSISKNHRICLANKETLVAAGELIRQHLAKSQSELIPIDSEQSAIFQSIGHHDDEFIRRIILTASGGPFFRLTLQNNNDPFAGITVSQALKHPTWSMGTKITIDSATLMNKALEVIEAFYLFRLKKEQIDVIIHPQSIIHSMVEFIDSSVLAQMSAPDMKLPILYSLSFPERIEFAPGRLDFGRVQKLEFYDVNTNIFPSIRLAYEVLAAGQNAGAVFNAANETAVTYFLQEKISFKDIFTVVEGVLCNRESYPLQSLQDVNATIATTKAKTAEYIKNLKSSQGRLP